MGHVFARVTAHACRSEVYYFSKHCSSLVFLCGPTSLGLSLFSFDILSRATVYLQKKQFFFFFRNAKKKQLIDNIFHF